MVVCGCGCGAMARRRADVDGRRRIACADAPWRAPWRAERRRPIDFDL